MSTLARNFTDPAWWMTVVVFGIVINLAAAYLKPTLDRLAARLLPKAGAAFRRSVEAFDVEIQSMRRSADQRTTTQLLKVEYLIKIIGALLLSTQLYGAASRADAAGAFYVGAIIHTAGVLSGLYAAGCLGRYRRFADTLRDAWRLGPIKNADAKV